VLSSGLAGAELALPGWKGRVEGTRSHHRHLVVWLSPGAVRRPVSYIRFPVSSLVRRVTDVTASAAPPSPDADGTLLLVNLRSTSRPEPAPAVDEVMSFLVRRGIVHGRNDIRASKWLTYMSVDSTDALRDALRAAPTRLVDFVPTFGDLAAATMASGIHVEH
jgi:hypothetical protein